MQNRRLRYISALCAARLFAYLDDMFAPAVLLRLELHPHPQVLKRVSNYRKAEIICPACFDVR
nr:hypothetical protein [Neisseria sp. 74A18]